MGREPDVPDNMLASDLGVWRHGQYWALEFGYSKVGT